MKLRYTIYIIIVILFFFIVGVIAMVNVVQKNNKVNIPVFKCLETCSKVKNKINLSEGPSLDQYGFNVSDWVCDVAHQPRTPIDNLPQNQCLKYRLQEAHHFVEVTPDCKLIRFN